MNNQTIYAECHVCVCATTTFYAYAVQASS